MHIVSIFKCADCVAYQAVNEERGQCRIYSPVIQMARVSTLQGDQIAPISLFPEVMNDCWCHAGRQASAEMLLGGDLLFPDTRDLIEPAPVQEPSPVQEPVPVQEPLINS